VSIDAMGFREATLHLSDAAIVHGFAAVVPGRLDLTASRVWHMARAPLLST
jgi:hypothetical protein